MGNPAPQTLRRGCRQAPAGYSATTASFWQMGELGKVDQGGGGTIAKYMANRDIDTIDAGVPVLSMHARLRLPPSWTAI